MNKKLTKLLSIFLIAGAVGAGAAGIAGCKNTHEHSLSYEDAGGGKHHVTCTGCDETFDDEDHTLEYENAGNGKHHASCTLCDATEDKDHTGMTDDGVCDDCGYLDFDEEGHEVAAYECNFQDPLVVQYNKDKKTSSPVTLGKFTIATGVYFESAGIATSNGKGNVNTQKQRISFNLSGENGWNRVSFKAKLASSGISSTTINLCKANGTVVKSFTLNAGDLGSFAAGFDFANKKAGDVFLPKGGYYIDCAEASLRLGDLKIQEYVAKSPVVSIRAVPAKSQYVVGATLDTNGLTVIAVKQNNSEMPLVTGQYTTDVDTIDMTTPGEKTVTVTYTPAEGEPITTTYKINVVAVTGLSVNSEFMQKVYIKSATATLDTANLCVYTELGNDPNNTEKITNFTATGYDLNTVGEQDVTISYGTNNTTVKITVIESAIQAVNDKATVSVNAAHNGLEGAEVSGVRTFKSLKNAIKYLEISNLDAAVQKIVNVEAGEYEEMISTSLSNLTLVGKGTNIDDTVLTYKVVEGMINPVTQAVWGLNAATLAVTGTGFKAYNIAIRNDFDYIKDHGKYPNTQGAQGLALSIGADRAVLYKCHLYGNQDTLYLKTGRAYFYQTQIDGNIDFIFGNEDGLAYFEECTIKAISRNGGDQEGYVTAMKGDRSAGKKYAEYGYIFDNCTFTDDGKCKEGSMSLGRTWGKNPSVAIINSKISKVYSKAAYGASGVKTTRYSSMNGTPVDAFFVEYNNTALAADNNGAITASVAGCTVMQNATNYTKANIFAAKNGTITWAAAWDCGEELKNLKILAGLEQGEISKDPNVTISFNGIDATTDLDTHIGEMFTYTGTIAWNVKNGVSDGLRIDGGTVIEFETPGKVAIEWYSNSTYGNPKHVILEYIEGGKCKITALQQTYIYGITLNTADVPAKSTAYTITYKYNDDNATADNTATTVIEGNYLTKPTDPTRAGYSFVGWHVDTESGTLYDFDSPVTGAITLVAEWSAGATEYQAGAVIAVWDLSKAYNTGDTGLEQGVEIDTTSGSLARNGTQKNANFTNGAKIKVKVAEGLTVLPVWHNATPAGGYSVSTRDADGYVTIQSLSNAYIMDVMVIPVYDPEAGGTINFDHFNATVSGHYADNGVIAIDAKASGASLTPNDGYVQINPNTVIKVKAPEGASDTSRLTHTIIAYPGNETNITDKYTLGFADGFYTFTGTSADHPDKYPGTLQLVIAPNS